MQPAPLFAEPRRLHPLSLVYRFLNSVPYFALLLFSLYQNPRVEDVWGAGLAVIAGLLTLPWIFLSYFRFRYQITPKEVVIERGVLTRQVRNIPLERIQNVEIRQSALQRLLGLARVRIETAGGAGSEGVLQYVDPPTARSIRQVIRAYREGLSEEAPERDPLSGEPTPEPEGTLLFRMSFREVVTAGAFRFSLVYIALIFGALQYTPYRLEDVIEQFISWITNQEFDQLVGQISIPPWVIVVAGIVLAALLSWLTSMIITVNRYARFRLWLGEGKVHKKHGLLTLSEGTIPLRRMQLFKLRANVLMRRFDRYALSTQIMGTDPGQQGSEVVLPLAVKEQALEIAHVLHPFRYPDTFMRVSPITIRRACIRYTVAVLVLIGPVAYFWRPALWGLLVLPLLYGLAVLQYRLHGYAVVDDHVFVRRGFWQHYVWMLPIERLQVLYTTATPFQRRLDLKTLHLDTAGGASFTYPRIVDLPAAEADALLAALYERFQAEFRDVPTEPETSAPSDSC